VRVVLVVFQEQLLVPEVILRLTQLLRLVVAEGLETGKQTPLADQAEVVLVGHRQVHPGHLVRGMLAGIEALVCPAVAVAVPVRLVD
jgi:hypothetical protein